jgi:hypothetical protein
MRVRLHPLCQKPASWREAVVRAPSRVRSHQRPAPRSVEEEIAQLRDLDLTCLRTRWQSIIGRPAAKHIPKHLLFGMLAYRLQADAFGDLDSSVTQLLKRAAAVQSIGEIQPLTEKMNQRQQKLALGTVLMREWNGEPHRVIVLADGFAFGSKTFDSLSKVAFAITGTKWNGPRFFGLRSSVKAARS